MYNLDVKDRKILYELDKDARQPCSKIGKKVRLSSEVVNYRIKRLEEENIITQYQVIVNLSKLNILQFKVCLSFQHLSSEKLEEIIKKLKQKKEVKWIVSCNGNWDLLISLETESIENIDLLKNWILTLFSDYINKKAISILVEASTFNRNYLLEDTLESERIIMKKDKVIELDELDIKIIKELSVNARKSIVDIAIFLKVSERVVNYRLNQLIKHKVLLGFKVAINYKKLGIKFYKTFIYLDDPDEIKVKQLIKFFERHKNIIHHVKVLGNWDLEPEFEVSSEEEFNIILNKIKDDFSDIIKNIETITISKEHKFVYF
jgi:Lrp/AsnC family transcriptional regulator, leucine-responsive regulatory protein